MIIGLTLCINVIAAVMNIFAMRRIIKAYQRGTLQPWMYCHIGIVGYWVMTLMTTGWLNFAALLLQYLCLGAMAVLITKDIIVMRRDRRTICTLQGELDDIRLSFEADLMLLGCGAISIDQYEASFDATSQRYEALKASPALQRITGGHS